VTAASTRGVRLTLNPEIYRTYVLCRGRMQRLCIPVLILLWLAMAGKIFALL
jgi:hypothetical protein